MLRRRFLAALMLAGTALPARAGAVTQDALPVELVPTGDWEYPWRAMLSMRGGMSRVELVRTSPE